MLGIGLGGFSKGLSSGYELGTKFQDDRREKKDRESYETAINEGTTEYKAAVESGSAKAGDPDGPLRYAMPKIVGPLLKKGDVAGAQAATEWVRSDQTKQGSRLFADGMLKGQNGDMAGALKDFVAAGRVQGYGADIEIGDPQPIEGGGFSVTVKGKDGNERSQVFKSPDEVLQFGAAYLNPQAAFSQWQEAQKSKSEYERDVRKTRDTERAKLGAKTEDDVVRTNLGIGTNNKDYVTAQTRAVANLKARKGSTFGATDPITQDEIEQETQRVLDEMQGRSPGIRDDELIVDPRTGELVSTAN